MIVSFNPHAAAQSQIPRGPQIRSAPAAPKVSDDGATITLSQAAQSILKNSGAGNSGSSPAHLAAAAAEGHTGPFGQLVKTFAPGHHESREVPQEGGDTGAVIETGDTTDTTVTDGTGTTDGGDTTVTDGTSDTGDTKVDGNTVVVAPEEGGSTGSGETGPTIVVEEPDITEVLDESAPADGETSETGTAVVGSGDAVASTGDGDTSDGDTIGDALEPVAVVDTGSVTDELLDLLDGNSEELV